jgi:FkbM family methyltransferase
VDCGELSVKGSAEALKYSRRELQHLDAVLAITPGRTAAVQAGGNLGLFPKRLAQEFATVYTFEPAADLFKMMQENAPEPNIIAFQAALGYMRELVETRRVRRDGSTKVAHEGITHVVPGGTIPTLRVDDLNLPVCDLLYLDIEGAELEALHGSAGTLGRCRPVVAVELNKNLAYVGLEDRDVLNFLHAQGYRHALTLGSDQVFVPEEWAR